MCDLLVIQPLVVKLFYWLFQYCVIRNVPLTASHFNIAQRTRKRSYAC